MSFAIILSFGGHRIQFWLLVCFFFKETWDLNTEVFHLEAHLMKGNTVKLKNQCVHTCECPGHGCSES